MGSGLKDFFNSQGADATFGECLAVDVGGPSWVKTGTNGECYESLFNVNVIIVSNSVDVHKVTIYLRRWFFKMLDNGANAYANEHEEILQWMHDLTWMFIRRFELVK